MADTQTLRFRLRGGIAAEWELINPTLLEREPGVETDTGALKLGDGIRAWNDLPYTGQNISTLLATASSATDTKLAPVLQRISDLESVPPGSFDDTQLRADISAADAAVLAEAKAYAEQNGGGGSAYNLTVGTVTEGPAQVTITGVAPDQVISFRVPRGQIGATGRGITSVTNPGGGTTATLLYTDNTSAPLPLPPGPAGGTGPAGTVAIGVVTVSSDGTAVVTNTGTSTAAVLDFTVPRGPAGQTGPGVPTGGTAGQVLSKTSTTNYAAAWVDPPDTGVKDHGALAGLADDDHPQYARTDGSRGAFAPTQHTHLWADTTDKPSAFPPATHSHALGDVTGLGTALAGKADDAQAVPPGGIAGQVLAKVSSTDNHVEWAAPAVAGDSGVTDHGALSGLTDDDHTQYALADGTRGSFAAPGHGHAVTDVTGLQTALDGKADDAHTHAWADVTAKPATYPPAAHAHGWTEITSKPTTFPPAAHGHGLGDVTGLQTALEGKADDGHAHGWAEITEKPETFPASTHGHAWTEITARPATYPPDTHTHGWTEITSKPAEFPPADHSHAWGEITAKPTTFPPSTHSHGWTEITGKPVTFTPTTHSHGITDITNLSAVLEGKADDSQVLPPGGGTGQILSKIDAADYNATWVDAPAGGGGDSGITDHGQLTGLGDDDHPLYARADGTRGAFAPPVHTHAWDDVTAKPTTFPAAAHTHAQEDVTGLGDALAGKAATVHGHTYAEITAKPTEFPPAAHTHAQDDVTGLSTALSGKSNTGHSHAYADITAKPTTFPPSTHSHAWNDVTSKPTTFPPTAHGHTWTEVTGKPTEFPPSAHSHVVTDVTGLQTALDDKSDDGHAHAWTEITAKPATFPPDTHTHSYGSLTEIPASFTPAAHTHAQTDVTGLTDALAGKAAATHTHDYASITAKPTTFTPSAHSHLWADISDKPSTFPPATHVHAAADTTSGTFAAARIPLATGSAQGAVSGALFSRLNNAATPATVSTLVIRDAAGRAQFVDPSALQDAATKNYVDIQVGTRAATSHSHTTDQVTGLDTALAGKIESITASASTVSSDTAAGVTVTGTGAARNLAFAVPAGAPAATVIDFKPGTDLPSTYPTGITIMEVGQTSSGWPASFAVIETVRFGVNRSFQTLVVRTSGKSYRRTPDANDAGWLPWIEWGAQGNPGTTEWSGITGKPSMDPAATAFVGINDADTPVGRGLTALDRRYRSEVSAAEFGAIGDGVADDTAALQAFIDHITANRRSGVLPGTNYRVTSTLVIPSVPGWTLRGQGNRGTLITQDTDNTPIIQLGNTSGTQLNHIHLGKMWLTYKNYQPATNTNAIPLYHYDMVWESSFEDLGFKRGHYASVVRSGIGMPWGCTWDNIHFGNDISGGSMNWGQGINAVPNNHFGRFFVELGPMAGPVFILRGYDFTWNTVEFIQADTDTPKLFSFMNGTKLRMGAFKVENSPLTVGKQLVDVTGNSYIDIGHISWNGGGLGTANLTSGTAYFFSLGAGASPDAHVRIGSVELYLAADTASPLYLYRCGTPSAQEASFKVDRLRLSNGWKAVNNGSNPTAPASFTVGEWVNGFVTARGDADYSVVLGDPSTSRFSTAFTSPRTITLPTDGSNIHSGLYYDFVFDGSINGANTATIKAGTRTVTTVTTDKSSVRVAWSRTVTASDGWTVTSHQRTEATTWTSLPGKPTEFTPATHTHATTEVTGLDTALNGKASTAQAIPAGGTTGQVLAKTSNTDLAVSWQTVTSGGSGVTDHGALTGLGDDDHSIYALADGTRGSFASTTHTHAWTAITSKPTTFAPSAHTHATTDVTGLTDALAGKAPTAHSHLWADISDKPLTFAPATHTHDYTTLTNIPATFAPAAHSHAWTEITAKPTTFPPDTHTHAYSSLTSIPTEFTPAAHTHAAATQSVAGFMSTTDKTKLDQAVSAGTASRLVIRDAAGRAQFVDPSALQDAATKNYVDTGLSGKAATSHSHTTAQVTGLDTALGGKSDTGHTHAYTSLTAIPTSFTPSAHTHDDRYYTETEVNDLLAAKEPASWTGTQAQYDALPSKSATTTYFITA